MAREPEVWRSWFRRRPWSRSRTPSPCDVAIIGMACYYPRANGLAEYWQNILDRVQAVTEIPETHWDWRLYYDPNPRARDKIISKWGGFLEDMPFDPLTFGITPNSLLSIEPLQLFLLEAVAACPGRRRLLRSAFPSGTDGRDPGHRRRRQPPGRPVRLPDLPAALGDGAGAGASTRTN